MKTSHKSDELKNINYQYQFIDLRRRAVFKLKKIEIRQNMTESQEKPLAT
jgi:hypothetical protein